ncbi:MAG: tRNA uridine-5-carboxymethylaminomethyl(34) synthesis enzyme MnmG, partial [Bacilli bacterium]|nr:tRNA uridine-5-carboxymethylaminomethyl(34) synthesis enzyme MnmG [Bacilli bacterium]
RAEFRLILRHDNADLRLTPIGHEIGLINEARFARFQEKYARIDRVIDILSKTNIEDKTALNAYLNEMGFPETNEGKKGLEILKRPHFSYARIAPMIPALDESPLDYESILALETKVKFEGYIEKEKKEAASLSKKEDLRIPADIDYLHFDGLRLEARQKLDAVRPETFGQASRIPGVNPADVALLLLTLKKENRL